MTLLFSGTVAVFVMMTLGALWHMRWARRLPALAESPVRVRCSVIVAARDEEARIEGTLRHLLAQRGIDVEVIAVDDRSTDGTGEILRRLAQEDPRLQVRRVDALPEGWLGKCHACHVGASAATGDWILFTDADCWLKPDVIARAVQAAERDAVDHVTLTPGTVVESLWAEAWHLLFLMSVLNWFTRVNGDWRGAYLGVGAFNLVRASVYRRCGGYEALRLTVVDDLKLALLMRRAGGRARAFLGMDDVECHWGTTVRQMVKIMEKNFFAVLEYRVWLAALGGAFALGMFGIVLAGLVSGTGVGLAAALSPLVLILPGIVLARRVGWTWWCAFVMPFMFPVYLYAILNSTVVTLRQGGIRWRDTFYPLETLRAGNVR